MYVEYADCVQSNEKYKQTFTLIIFRKMSGKIVPTQDNDEFTE